MVAILVAGCTTEVTDTSEGGVTTTGTAGSGMAGAAGGGGDTSTGGGGGTGGSSSDSDAGHDATGVCLRDLRCCQVQDGKRRLPRRQGSGWLRGRSGNILHLPNKLGANGRQTARAASSSTLDNDSAGGQARQRWAAAWWTRSEGCLPSARAAAAADAGAHE